MTSGWPTATTVRGGGSVTDVDASTGILVRLVTGTPYRFDHPVAIAADGSYVFVANDYGNSITLLASPSGSLVSVLSAPNDHFDGPVSIAFDGIHAWVVNVYGDSVTEFEIETAANKWGDRIKMS